MKSKMNNLVDFWTFPKVAPLEFLSFLPPFNKAARSKSLC
jgi:hypothetical protein